MEQFKLDLFTDEQKQDLESLKKLADKKLNSDTPGPFKDDVLTEQDKNDLAVLKKDAVAYLDNKLDIYDSEPKPDPSVAFDHPNNWNFKAKDYLDAKVKSKKYQDIQKEIEDENKRLEAKTFSTPYLDVPPSEAHKVKAIKMGKSPDYRWDHKKHQFIHRKTKKITPTREVVDAFDKSGPIKFTKVLLNNKPKYEIIADTPKVEEPIKQTTKEDIKELIKQRIIKRPTVGGIDDLMDDAVFRLKNPWINGNDR